MPLVSHVHLLKHTYGLHSHHGNLSQFDWQLQFSQSHLLPENITDELVLNVLRASLGGLLGWHEKQDLYSMKDYWHCVWQVERLSNISCETEVIFLVVYLFGSKDMTLLYYLTQRKTLNTIAKLKMAKENTALLHLFKFLQAHADIWCFFVRKI